MNEENKNFLSTKLFDDKTVSDLVKITFERNVKINQTIDEFLDMIKASGISPSELIALLPIIKDYLNTANHSDDTLVKLLGTISKYVVDPNKNQDGTISSSENIEITDEDRELFERINNIMNEDKNN